MDKAKRGAPKKPRLTDQEKLRRGTLQRVRAVAPAVVKESEPEVDYAAWLAGLSPVAQFCGRRFLAYGVPFDREVFRDYCEASAVCEVLSRRSPGTIEEIEARVRANQRATTLLHDKLRWRVR